VYDSNGHLISYYFSKISSVATKTQTPHITPLQAVKSAAKTLSHDSSISTQNLVYESGFIRGNKHFFSAKPIKVKLGYYAHSSGELEMVYQLRIKDLKLSWYVCV
jgi:hypothetical protein